MRGATGRSFHSGINSSFQPTLPVRGATLLVDEIHQNDIISTHAPRAGSDHHSIDGVKVVFISTHAPRAGSDCVCILFWFQWLISTHAPRAGSDPCSEIGPAFSTHFNPRSPCGERHLAMDGTITTAEISTHAPRAGSDLICNYLTQKCKYFNPRSPCGERHGLR